MFGLKVSESYNTVHETKYNLLLSEPWQSKQLRIVYLMESAEAD